MDYPWAAFGSGFGKLIKLIMQYRHKSVVSLLPPPLDFKALNCFFLNVCKLKGNGCAAKGWLAEPFKQDVVSLR